MGAEVGSTRRGSPRGPTMTILGFVILTLVSSSGRAAAVNDAQEHDINMKEAAVIGLISVDSETSLLPEMAPIEGTTRRSREEKKEDEEEYFVEEWSVPSMSSSTEDESIAPSGAASVFEGDVGVSASGIELEHTQEDGAEMGDADVPSIDATPPDTAEGALTDADSFSSISPDSHDEFDANDGFVAEEENGGSSLDSTHVSSSARGGDDAADVNAAAAHEIAATGREEKEKENDERGDENDSHQQERKQELDAEEVTLARDPANEESVRGVVAALASSDGVGEQAVAGGGDGEREGDIQAGKDGGNGSGSGNGNGSGSTGFDKESLSDAAAPTVDSVAAEATGIVDAVTATERRLPSTGVMEQGSNEAQTTSTAGGSVLEIDSTTRNRDGTNDHDAWTESSADSKTTAARRPAAGGDRQQARPAGASKVSDGGEGLASNGSSRGRNQDGTLRAGRVSGGESKGEARENDGKRFGNGGSGSGSGSGGNGGSDGGTHGPVGDGSGAGFGRSSPGELAQRVRDVEAELLRKFLAEEDAKSLLDIWIERAREYVLTQTVPPTDAECDFNWSRLRCEPKCSCGARLRFGDYTPGRTCRLLHHWETSPECEGTWDPSDEPAAKRLAAAAVWALGSARRAYEARVAPPSDPECGFSLATRRCEPQAWCGLKFRWGDLTLSSACRLIEEERPANARPWSPVY